jgi:hypothetical protein
MTRLAEVKQQLAKAKARVDVLESAVRHVVRSKPETSERVKDQNGGTLILSAYGLEGADGGMLIVRYRFPRQKDQVNAVLFDEYRAMVNGESFFSYDAVKPAVERIAAYREKLYEALR